MAKLQVLPEPQLSLQVMGQITKAGEPVILPVHIAQNGTYYAGADKASGYNPVTVDVDMTPAKEEGYLNGYEIGAKEGAEVGYNKGKAEAIESLPTGYIKVDPTWTDFSHFCDGRRYSLGENLKYSDTTNGTNFSQMFYGWDYGGPHTIPSLDLRKGTNFQNMFKWSARIVEIGEMDISNATNVTGMFGSCSDLEQISFVQGCLKISISFASSGKLNDASIQSIIDGLADLTGATAQTLTFHADVGAKLTPEQKAAITSKNWTLVY